MYLREKNSFARKNISRQAAKTAKKKGKTFASLREKKVSLPAKWLVLLNPVFVQAFLKLNSSRIARQAFYINGLRDAAFQSAEKVQDHYLIDHYRFVFHREILEKMRFN